MRRILVAGNWKMHGSQSMTAELINGISERLQSLGGDRGFDVLVCPPSPYLGTAKPLCADAGIALGAQNVSPHEQGAYTGEIALPMLTDFGCDYVLLGHSERREIYGETDAEVAEKFAACVAESSSVVPVLCIGETLEQRQAGDTESVIDLQLDAVLQVTGIAGFERAVIAYEPVWAIGTGETATPEQAQQVHRFIRDRLSELDNSIASKLQILYGGSMKPGNAAELLAQPDIDGGLIGGAALQADSFVGICEAAHALDG